MSSGPNHFFERISKVQKELSRLEEVLARQQQFNQLHVRKMLEQPPPSSDSSNFSTEENIVYRQQQEDESTPAEIGCLESSQSLFIEETLQNITKSTQNREEEAAAFVLKLESELMASSMETQKAVHIGSTTKTDQKKRKLDSKPQAAGSSSATGFQPSSGLLNGHRVKSPKSTIKGSLKNISMKKSESYKELKKSMAASQVQYHAVDRRKSSNKPTPFGKVTYPTASNVFDGRRGPVDEPFRPLEVRSPKLNKINVNRLKQTIKKSNGDGKKGLEERLHLNLNEGKTLMQRIIERRNFFRQYQTETKKYESVLKEIDERSLHEQLNSNALPMQAVDALVIFLSQFSLKLTKRLLNCEVNSNQFNHKDVVRELWKMVNAIPAKLFKHNVVSEQRYHGLIRKCDGLWSNLQQTGTFDRVKKYKFMQLLQTVRGYMEYLFRNHLIETTQRNNLYTKRRVMDYYSHRSDNEVIRKENAASIPIESNKLTIKKKKPMSKGYQTQRRLNIDEPAAVKPDLKKKNVNALKQHLYSQNKVLPDKNMQLSTRSGKYYLDEEPKKAASMKRQMFLRK